MGKDGFAAPIKAGEEEGKIADTSDPSRDFCGFNGVERFGATCTGVNEVVCAREARTGAVPKLSL
jgi:hypothetical protein